MLKTQLPIAGVLVMLLSPMPASATTATVPEPSTLTLLASGAAGLAIWGVRTFLKKPKK
jgi:PEP-CTERM motif